MSDMATEKKSTASKQLKNIKNVRKSSKNKLLSKQNTKKLFKEEFLKKKFEQKQVKIATLKARRRKNKGNSVESQELNKYKKNTAKLKKLTRAHSKEVLNGKIVSTTGYEPNVDKYVIEINKMDKSYITSDLKTTVLTDLNVKIKKGQIAVILGVSGSGKTTLLNIISGLDKGEKGDVFVLGNNLSLLSDNHLTLFRRRHVGFIFQQYNLLHNLNVWENAQIGGNLASKKNKENQKFKLSVDDILTFIDMADHKNKYPHQLSGGQQQRVSIARALAKNPSILFGDEPTGALDEKTGDIVLSLLRKINRELKTTIILVTHNPQIAEMADVVLHVRNHKIDEIIENKNPKLPKDIDIDWSN